MADSFIAVSGSGSYNVDTEQLTVSAQTVYRQRMEVAGASASDIARVLNSDAAVGTTLYGLLVRLAGRVPPEYLNGTLLQQLIVVGTSAVALPASPLTNRRKIVIVNGDLENTLYLGSATVANSGAAAGIPVGPGQKIELNLGPSSALYGIASAASTNVYILEMAE